MKEGNLSFLKNTFPSFHDFSNLFDIEPTSSLKEDMNNNATQFQAAPSLVLQFMVPIENLSQSNKIVLRQVENVYYHVRTRQRNTKLYND